jgi:hypothetical protein
MGDLLSKKKIKVAIAALVLWAGARFGLELDPAAVDRVIDLAMVVIAAIGLEDWGKARIQEAAKAGGSIAEVTVHTTQPPPVAPPVLPKGQGRRSGLTPTTIPGLGERARQLREEAKARATPTPPLEPPPKRPG